MYFVEFGWKKIQSRNIKNRERKSKVFLSSDEGKMCSRESYSMHNYKYVYLGFKIIASASKIMLSQMRNDYHWMNMSMSIEHLNTVDLHDIRFY